MEKRNILVIEDDEDWQYILTSYLKDIPANITVVADYDSALKVLDTNSFDILVLDLRLEDKDDKNFQGMELLTYLRNQKSQQAEDAYVIIISAYGTQDHIRKGFKSYGLLDYIPKQSFNKKEFIATVNKALIKKKSLE
jgi:CheY-like chemotaxis protein